MPNDTLRRALERTPRIVGQGVVVGLFIGRVLAESVPIPWRLPGLLALIATCVGFGCAIAWSLNRVCRHTWPIALLALYLLWPRALPLLSYSILAATLGLLLTQNLRSARCGYWPESVLLAGSLGLYIATLAPTVLPADSGEFQLVSHVLGIAHPPGYPLYTLLGKLFTLLPVGDIARRVNLFAAVCGALTVSVVAHTVRRTSRSSLAALIAGASLALSTTFWAQSTTANIRSLTALLTALCIDALLRWGEEQSSRALVSFGVLYGLGAGHHASVALLGLPFVAYILAREPNLPLQPRRWAPAAAALAASSLVLLYLPLRSLMGAPFDSEPIRSLSGFLNHVLALGFRGDLFAFQSLPELSTRLRIWIDIIVLQFGFWLPVAMGLSVFPLASHRKHVLLLLAGVWAVNTLAAITYRAPQTVEYLIPSYVALALLLGCGLGLLLRAPRVERVAQALSIMLLLAAAWNGFHNYPSFRALHTEITERAYAEALLFDAPPNSLILANWHHATPLWYLQQVEGHRPDVQVDYVYPEGATPNEQVWLRRIGEAIAERPVLVTNTFYAYQHAGYRFVPFHGAWLVREMPLEAPPQQITTRPVDFEDGIELLGYSFDAPSLQPGGIVNLDIYWRPTQPLERDYTTFVQIVGPQGVVGQGDIAQITTSYLSNEVRVDTYRFPLLLHASPGDYQVVTGFYWMMDDGWKRLRAAEADTVVLDTLTVQPARSTVATLHPRQEVWEGGWQLAGVDYDRGVPGQTRLYLHWWHQHPLPLLGATPASNPQALSVRALHGESVLAEVTLPNLPTGTGATIVMDLPHSLTEVTLSLVYADGRPLALLGPWHRRAVRDMYLRIPTGPLRYVPLGGEMVFVGLDRPPASVQPPRNVRLQPRLLSLRPLVQDYSLSLGLRRDDLGWELKSDGTPALGAIPTLKWVRGWVVTDRHSLAVPVDAPQGAASITLEVYDAFTLEPLQVLDERLVREGQGTRLRIGQVPVQ